MLIDRTSAACRARLRARVAACLLADAGDTLIEVMVAALLVALIAVATFTGYSVIAHIAGGQRTRAQASTLAEADQARLHGLTLDNLVGSTGATGSSGNTSYTQTVDNTVYTVTSSTKFVSGGGAAACTTNGTSTADEVQTTSTVTWPADAAAGGPVEIHGLVTPPEGGSLIARVVDSNGNPIAGVSVSLSGGPTYTSPLTTDSNGCVEFGGLSGGTYVATATVNGVGTSATAPTVVPTQTSNVTLTPGGDGGISATFSTTYNGSSHASSADQVTAWNSVYPAVYNVFGSPSTLSSNTYLSTVTSGSVFGPGNYEVYAGSCAGDQSSGGEKLATVTTNTTQAVSLPLPAMIVDVYGNTNTEVDDAPSSSVVYTGSHWTHGSTGNQNYDSTESFDLTGGDYVKFTFTGTSVEWIAPVSSNGGYTDVYVDGTKVASNVTTYSATTAYQQVIWSDTGLSNASHTVELLVDGTKPAASSATYLQLDAFIYGTPTLLTAQPVVTVTDNNSGCSSSEDYPQTVSNESLTHGALADPGQPYGNYTVCASSGGVENTATVANTSYVTGNPVNIYLGAGSSGLTNGSCT
jgi:Tfp pilus assembly protein PilE